MHPPDDARARLSLAEWLYLAALILGWAVFVVAHGKDMSWDFRNYHWYIPYAFLNGRMGFDVAVAHQATFYNPFLDIPFYWLATHTHSWFALGVLGAVQGANVVPVYFIAREVVFSEQRKIIAGAAALLALTGSLTISLAGATYYDDVMSVFVLTGLALIIVQRNVLQDGPLWRREARQPGRVTRTRIAARRTMARRRSIGIRERRPAIGQESVSGDVRRLFLSRLLVRHSHLRRDIRSRQGESRLL